MIMTFDGVVPRLGAAFRLLLTGSMAVGHQD